MADDKLYTSLSANTIMAKLTNHVQRTGLEHHRLTNTIHLTLKMTSAQVVETSVTINSSFQNYPHPDDHTTRTTDTPGFKPFTIFIIMFAFLYEKVNAKKICEEISFPSFSRKMLMSVFLSRFKANYLEKNAWLPQFFFVDSNSPCKDLLLPRGPNLAQKPLYLVGIVPKLQ